MKKRFLTSIIMVLVILTMIFAMTACNNVPANYQGKYTYTSNSYIVVNKSTCDYTNVYVGDVYYEDGTYAGILTFSGTGLSFETEKISNTQYKIVAKKEYNSGTVTVTSYLYDNNGNPYISLAGRRYSK